MSLMELARAAQAEAENEAGGPGGNFASLRAYVQQSMTAHELVAMIEKSPRSARSEIRRACERAFEQDWRYPKSDQERSRLINEVVDSIFGFGPIEGLLSDDAITEIMVNGPDRIFYEKGGQLHLSEQHFANEEQLRALIDRIVGPIGRRVDEASPMVNARLPEGHRVNIVVPPLALDGPVVTIRKFSDKVLQLRDLVRSGSVERSVAILLEWAVRSRCSIAVTGGTGSGKTTLLNALSCCISARERIVTIEDSAELRFRSHPHVVRLEARQRNAEGLGEVTIRDLVINALRMRPDRIVVGECRGAEALDMLQAMTTGHDGSMTTLHANSPFEVASRLTTMVRYGADLPVDAIEANIAAAFDVIVHVARDVDGRRYLSSVASITFDQEQRSCAVNVLYSRDFAKDQGVWLGVPSWVSRLGHFGVSEQEVVSWRSTLRCA